MTQLFETECGAHRHVRFGTRHFNDSHVEVTAQEGSGKRRGLAFYLKSGPLIRQLHADAEAATHDCARCVGHADRSCDFAFQAHQYHTGFLRSQRATKAE